MKRTLENGLHHVRETATLFGTSKVSNLLSLLSTTLVFLFLGLLLLGWRVSSHWVALLQSEAEIQVFVTEDGAFGHLEQVRESMEKLDGMERVVMVSSEEARTRMAELLGGDEGVLSHLERNPFRPFLEARIRLDDLDGLLERLKQVDGVESVRDNRDVLESLMRMEQTLRTIGLLFGGAVALFTLVLMFHITRAGVVHNREQIRTLRLLGAPETHISGPFFLLGLLLGGGGGLLAAAAILALLAAVPWASASPLSFLPFPSSGLMRQGLVLLLGGAGAVLGSLGTLAGLVSARDR